MRHIEREREIKRKRKGEKYRGAEMVTGYDVVLRCTRKTLFYVLFENAFE